MQQHSTSEMLLELIELWSIEPSIYSMINDFCSWDYMRPMHVTNFPNQLLASEVDSIVSNENNIAVSLSRRAMRKKKKTRFRSVDRRQLHFYHLFLCKNDHHSRHLTSHHVTRKWRNSFSTSKINHALSPVGQLKGATSESLQGARAKKRQERSKNAGKFVSAVMRWVCCKPQLSLSRERVNIEKLN